MTAKLRRFPGPYCDRHDRPMRQTGDYWDGDWVCPEPACRVKISRDGYAKLTVANPDAAEIRVFQPQRQ